VGFRTRTARVSVCPRSSRASVAPVACSMNAVPDDADAVTFAPCAPDS
jgi:hypothetical protein